MPHILNPATCAQAVSAAADVDEIVADPQLFVAPKNPQARLDGMPDELVLAVFELLPDAALAQLCLTSKRYNGIATEYLYECIDETRESGQNYGAMKAIDNNTLLGKHIKKLTLCSIDDGNDEEQVRYVGGRGLSTRVLCAAVNVKMLEIAYSPDFGAVDRTIVQKHGWVQVFDEAHFHTVDESVNTFQNLTDITIDVDTDSNLGFGHIASIFQLPTIESISLWGIVENAPMKNWRVPTSSSKVKRLRIKDSFVDSTAMAQLLNSLKTLVKFEYNHDADIHRPGGPEEDPGSHLAELSWTKILEALKAHRKSLTSLSLRELHGFTAPSFHDNNNGKIGSLIDFAKLEELSLDVEILLDMASGEIDLAKRLPKVLQRIILRILPKVELRNLYGPVIQSLRDGVFNKEEKQLYIICQRSMEIGLAGMTLSGPIEALSHAGINTMLKGFGKPGWLGYKCHWALDDLRNLEEAGASGGTTTDDGEEAANDEEEEEAADDGEEAEGDEEDDTGTDDFGHFAPGADEDSSSTSHNATPLDS